jgi:hypothetical protein
MHTPDQRRWIADKIADLGNLAAGALLFGQFIAGTFRFAIALAGILIVLLAYIYGYYLLKSTNKL